VDQHRDEPDAHGNAGTTSVSLILPAHKKVRKMADAKKALSLAAVRTALENVKTKYNREMSELREQSLKNEQFCTGIATACRKLADAALASQKLVEKELQELIDHAKERASTAAPAKPPAKKS
jgi:hypothetical protein